MADVDDISIRSPPVLLMQIEIRGLARQAPEHHREHHQQRDEQQLGQQDDPA